MKYAQLSKASLILLCAIALGWAAVCGYRYTEGQIVLADVVVLAILGLMVLWGTASSAGKASHARTHNARANSLGDTAYRRLRRRNGESSEAEWEAQRQAREAAEAVPPYISPANISATCVTLQPTEDGRELGDHGLILSVLAALRSADALPLPDRSVLKQLVYEMAYRFAADSGMEERDRAGILAERKAERKMDAYANHCQGIQELRARAAQAASENASDSVGGIAIDAYALRVDELARRVEDPAQDAAQLVRRSGELAASVMSAVDFSASVNGIPVPPDPPVFDPISHEVIAPDFTPPTDGGLFVHNPNSPEALDALLDAVGALDPSDIGDALAYAFVGLDPAKPRTDQTVHHRALSILAGSSLSTEDLEQLVKNEPFGAIIKKTPSSVIPLASGTALHLFAAERSRQVQAKGHTPEQDDSYSCGEMASAAAVYALPSWNRIAEERIQLSDGTRFMAPMFWPWHPSAWKPAPNDRLREVVKAGALLLAEAERLIRAEQVESPTSSP